MQLAEAWKLIFRVESSRELGVEGERAMRNVHKVIIIKQLLSCIHSQVKSLFISAQQNQRTNDDDDDDDEGTMSTTTKTIKIIAKLSLMD